MMRAAFFAPLVAALAVVVACGGSSAPDPRYPAREAGCDIKLFHEAPTMDTSSLGTVSARCDVSVSDDDCLRQLKDQACKLGADVIWGIPEKPATEYGKKQWSGRAVHTRAK